MPRVVIAGSENSTQFAVIDFTTPGSPRVALVNPGFGAGCRVAVDGRKAVAGSVLGSQVRLIDVSNPSGPVVQGVVATGLAGIGAVAIAGDRVAVGEQNGTDVVLIDVGTLAHPVVLGRVRTKAGGFSSLAFRTLRVVAGSGPNDFDGFEVDFSDPAHPTLSSFRVDMAGSPSLDADSTAGTIAVGDSAGVNVKLLDGVTKSVLATANSGLDSVTVALSGRLVLAGSPNSVQAARIDFGAATPVTRFNPGLGGGCSIAIDGGTGACGAILGTKVALVDLNGPAPHVLGTADAGIPSIATLGITQF